MPTEHAPAAPDPILADLAAAHAEVTRLREELARREAQLARDLAVAHRIQLSLIPRQLPECTGWRLASAYHPARAVGGDFLDAFDLPHRPSCVAVHIGDVTGKGIAAALVMAFSRAVLRAAGYNSTGPSDSLARANRVLTTDVQAGLFLTAVAVELNPSGDVRWCSAGHEPPYLLRAGSRDVVELTATGPMLGLFSRWPGEDETETMGPGDRLVLWTDGVTDAQRSGGERFGDGRLKAVLADQASDAPPQTIVDAVVDAVADWSDGAEPADDLTLVVIERSD